MIGNRLSAYVHNLAQRLGPATVKQTAEGPRYEILPPLFEISSELIRQAHRLPIRPALLVFGEHVSRATAYACPLTPLGVATFAFVSLLRALEVAEALAFLVCAKCFGVKPSERMNVISWRWIFGSDFRAFRWRDARYAIGYWTVRVIPR